MRSAALAAGIAVLAVSSGCTEPVHRVEPLDAMGRDGSIELYMGNADAADEVLAGALETIERIGRKLDFRDPSSPLAELNREAAKSYYTVEDADVYRAALLALDYAQASRGAFDPTLGRVARLYADGADGDARIASALDGTGWDGVAVAHEARAILFRRSGIELDLGGVAKGYALHLAARGLATSGSYAALFVLGGNAYAWNAPPGEEGWSVPMRDPARPARTLLTLKIANRGVAISGQRRAGAETLLDPASGRPVEGDVVWAIGTAHTAGDADAFATAMAASTYNAATDLLGRMRKVEAALLIRDGDSMYLLASASLRGRLALEPDFEAEIDGDVRYLLPPTEFPEGPA